MKNPQMDLLDAILDNTPIIIGDLILAEVIQGFRYDPDFEKVRRVLGKFMKVGDDHQAGTMCITD